MRTKQANSGLPENVVLGSLASEAYCGSLTVLVQMEYTVNQREEVMGCIWKKKIHPHEPEQVEVEKI